MKILKDLNLKTFNIDARQLRPKDFFKGIIDYRQKILPKYKHLIKRPDAYVCTLCRGTKGSLFLEWTNSYQLYKCYCCGAISPNIVVPHKDSHGELIYEDKEYREKFHREIHQQFDYRKEQYGNERYQYTIGRLDLPTNARVLDLGCGAGYFLSVLSDRNINYKGLETASHLAEYCQTYHGLNVESSPLEDEPNSYYDLITMFDVLEHVENPTYLLSVVKAKLKNGGYCIAYTPNIHSVGYELMGSEQNTLLPFEHLCFFNSQSFRYLADETGFTIKTIDTYGLDIMDYLLMKEYKDGVTYIDTLTELINLLQAILDKYEISNHFRVTFREGSNH